MVDLSEYDTIIKSLVAIAARQGVTNRRLEEHVQDIKTFAPTARCYVIDVDDERMST